MPELTEILAATQVLADSLRGTDGATIRESEGSPPDTLGADGDWCVDTANSRFYGPKTAGAWPATYVSLGGTPGPSGTITVGSVTATAPGSTPTVTNSGTPEAAILDFELPRGEPGPEAWAEPEDWATDTVYTATSPRSVVVFGGETFVCLEPHTSGTFSEDRDAGRWRLVAKKGAESTGGSGGTGGDGSTVSPLAFGALGDGATDDTAAVVAALESGKVVHDPIHTFAVSGNVQPTTACAGITALKLKQLNPNGPERRTLIVAGHTGKVFENIFVDRGGQGDQTTSADMLNNFGVYMYQNTDCTFRNIKAKNGGVGTLVAIFWNTDCAFANISGHDCTPTLAADPGDDRVQGVWAYRNKGCKFSFLGGRNLGVLYPGAPTLANGIGRKWSRGVARGLGNTSCTFAMCWADTVDQGVDITGSDSEVGCVDVSPMPRNCTTWGVKLANTVRLHRILGGYAYNCGFAGFVVSGPSGPPDAGAAPTEDIIVRDFISHNSGRNGFECLEGSYSALYPQKVRLIDCVALDDRGASATMQYGFRDSTVKPEPWSADAGLEVGMTLEGCKSTGHVTAISSGVSDGVVMLRRTSAFSVANGSYQPMDFAPGSTVEDQANQFSEASNNSTGKILRAGVYVMSGAIEWAANASGARGVRLVRNGAPIPGGCQEQPASASGNSVVQATAIARFDKGDTFRIEGFQGSSGPLNAVEHSLQLAPITYLG